MLRRLEPARGRSSGTSTRCTARSRSRTAASTRPATGWTHARQTASRTGRSRASTSAVDRRHGSTADARPAGAARPRRRTRHRAAPARGERPGRGLASRGLADRRRRSGRGPGPRRAVTSSCWTPGTLELTSRRRPRCHRRTTVLAASGWPELHCPRRGHAARPGAWRRRRPADGRVAGTARSRPARGGDWEGSITARLEGRTVVFEYDCTYHGCAVVTAPGRSGLTLRPPRELTDLWWRRNGEWSVYPPDPRRPARRATRPGRPGSNTPLHPARTWEGTRRRRAATTTGASSGRIRRRRRDRRPDVADGPLGREPSTSGRARSTEADPARPRLVRRRPHVEGKHPIWSAYFGAGQPIGR
jgi:hypothetical protein